MVPALLEGFGSPTLLCVAGSRMFFNLKEAAEHGVNIGTNWSSHTQSTMQFDEPEQQLEHETNVFLPEDSESNDPSTLTSVIQSLDIK